MFPVKLRRAEASADFGVPKGAHSCGLLLSDGGTQSTELCTTVDKLYWALWPAPMAPKCPPVEGDACLRGEAENCCVHTACTERR